MWGVTLSGAPESGLGIPYQSVSLSPAAQSQTPPMGKQPSQVPLGRGLEVRLAPPCKHMCEAPPSPAKDKMIWCPLRY
jgi:hypothetical protein